MKHYQKNNGFTLIELLVVVLIIGILSAIALPQYQRAVEKSRVATMQPLVRSLADAQKRYKMANGDVTRSFADLDVALPGNCIIQESDYYGEEARCGKIYLHPTSASLSVQGILHLSDSSVIYMIYPAGQTTGRGSKNRCMACPGENTRANDLCLSMGSTEPVTDNDCLIYLLP